MERCNGCSEWSFICMDCTACTLCGGEYYMVTDEVWHAANPKDRGMLCIGCLEQRLGKKLTTADFTACPLNDGGVPWEKSDRFLERLAR